ncbi:MAG TPA: hypothetical protein VFW23_00135 [Tepidisphaeraceae bacterium]|nr:hypothetical protein [Tepidisphaeraceae bacterium]
MSEQHPQSSSTEIKEPIGPRPGARHRRSIGISDSAIQLIRWFLIALVFAAAAAAIIVRGSGYSGATSDGGKYYVSYKSTQYEVTRVEFEHVRFHNRVSTAAISAIAISLFVLAGWESIRSGGRRNPLNIGNDLARRVRLLRIKR